MLHLLMHVCLRAFTISRVANNSIKRIEVGKSANLPEMAEYMRLPLVNTYILFILNATPNYADCHLWTSLYFIFYLFTYEIILCIIVLMYIYMYTNLIKQLLVLLDFAASYYSY